MKKIIALSVLLSIIMLTTSLKSQVSQEWVRTNNGSGNSNDESAAIIYDGHGNVIVTGRAISTGNNNDFYTVKYSSSGVQQWAVTYNGAAGGFDAATGVAADNSGNVYVTGQTINSASNYDIALIKYSPAGVQQWVRIWNGSGNNNDIPNAITSDSSGNTYITGYTEVSGFNSNYITLKYNPEGILQWAKEYNNPINSSDIAYYIKTDLQMNVYVTGTSTALSTGSDFLTIKYTPNGDSSWVKRYSGTTAINEIPQGLAVDNSGNVYVTGFSRGTSNSTDFATIKYNTNGVQQWVVVYDSTGGQDIPEDLEADEAGNVYVTGRTRINSSYNDFATIKYNSAGVRQWIAIYDNVPESRDDYGYDLALDDLGNVYVTGNSQQSGTNRDALTIKYSNSGNQLWVARFDETESEETFGIVLDESKNVYVAGYREGVNTDYLTIKYSQSVGINQISNSVPGNFRLSQNYPNPFNPETVISFHIPEFSFVSLKVYNILGNEIETLVNEQVSSGIYSVKWDASNLSSGSYFYKLQTEKFSDVKRMVFIK